MVAPSYKTFLEPEQIEAIVQGQYEDIFSVLGLHTSDQGMIFRVFLPNADKVSIVDKKTNRVVLKLTQIHEQGLFEGLLKRRKKVFDYCLHVYYGKTHIVKEDVYRFKPNLRDEDIYLFGEGTQEQTYQWMGAHRRNIDAVDGVCFTVWAPEAKRVAVVGDFNHWDGRGHIMQKHYGSGIWALFVPGIQHGDLYKFELLDQQGALLPLKADLYGRSMQHPPETASRIVFEDRFEWTDKQWLNTRNEQQSQDKPVSIYEVHAASWRRKTDQGNRYLSYLELADELLPYVVDMGFTHIQLMPISEYPFDGSWGYQPVGMFAPSIRFGTPDEFRQFVDCCHQQNIGVLLDWVPGHFPNDAHGLGKYDGSALYEHHDVRKGFHPDWNTLIYNYGRNEVVSFLLSNAYYWIDEYHLDGLRVDAVASMLYLDYSRKDGEWLPNKYGGRENLEAIALLRKVNQRVIEKFPGVIMVAEESTAWPGVSRSVDQDGLGFSYKWNMGWMNDSLKYMEREAIHRQYHHSDMTFSTVYAFDENFILPLSHDEVVHGKGALLNKMPGDEWQQFANLRAYYGFMWAHPGKKLLFMGGEFAQRKEWDHDHSLDWHLLEQGHHQGVQLLVKDLNRVYRTSPALYEQDCDGNGFQWLQHDNAQQSIFVWLRKSHCGNHRVVVMSNMTPSVHHDYRIGVPMAGYYREILNTDSELYGGSNMGNIGGVYTDEQPCNEHVHSINVTVPPLATVMFEWSH